MKKITSILTAALVLFALTACNVGADSNKTQEENNEYLVTEDTEFAPGWYKYTTEYSTKYYYFDDTQLCTRTGNETEELSSDEEGISWEELMGKGYPIVKITEDELPDWAKTTASTPVEPVEEQTEFTVILEGYDVAKKIPVIKAVREITGLGLGEAKALVEGAPKALVEGAPKIVKEGVSKEDADKMIATLTAAGGIASKK